MQKITKHDWAAGKHLTKPIKFGRPSTTGVKGVSVDRTQEGYFVYNRHGYVGWKKSFREAAELLALRGGY